MLLNLGKNLQKEDINNTYKSERIIAPCEFRYLQGVFFIEATYDHDY